MKGQSAETEKYELIELLDQTVLFTNSRIDRSTVPNGIYAYDIRDDGCGNFCSVEPNVIVNHAATVLCKHPIEMLGGDYRTICEYDYNFLDEECSLSEFMEQEETEIMATEMQL